MKILAVGGGSGGHVTPVVAVIDQLYQLDSSVQVRFICDSAFEVQARGLMKRAAVPVQVSTIVAGKFRRYSHLTFWQHFTVPHVVIKNTADVAKVIIGFVQSAWHLVWHRPDVVFAKGGYVCLPVGVAAWLLRVPLVIHDSDTRPGLTNRVLARFATVIATGSPLKNYPYDRKKSTYVGVPIGEQFTPVDHERQRAFKQAIGADPEKRLVVGTGGGLGAPSINNAMIMAAPLLAEQAVALYNVTGKNNFDSAVSASSGLTNYTPVPFVYEHMEQVLGAADLVVARGSATFLQELAGLEKAVIVVPARQLGDQIKNAQVYGEAGAARVITDDELLHTTKLQDSIIELLGDDSQRRALAAALHSFARPHAAADMAKLIIQATK